MNFSFSFLLLRYFLFLKIYLQKETLSKYLEQRKNNFNIHSKVLNDDIILYNNISAKCSYIDGTKLLYIDAYYGNS